MADLDCIPCKLNFDSRSALKAHLTAAPHSCLRIICPWCIGEKVISRIADLKRHVESQHSGTELALPPNFFSEGNGYWLALKPEEYSRVCKVSEQESPAATLARNAMLAWLDSEPKSSRTKDTWIKGWKLGDDSEAERPSKRRNIEPTVDPLFKSEDFTVMSVRFLADSIKADVRSSSSGVWYEVTICKTVTTDAKHLAALTRRLTVIAGEEISKPSGTDVILSGLCDRDFKKAMTEVLGVPLAFLLEIRQRQTSVGARKPFPTMSSIPAMPEATTTEAQSEPAGIIIQQTRFSVIPSAETPIPSSAATSPVIPVTTPTYDPSSPTYNPSYPALNLDPEKPASGFQPSPQIPIYRPTPLTNHRSAFSSQGVISSATSLPVKVSSTVSSVKERALSLLRRGVMPLLPPARRDWGTTDNSVILCAGSDTISWPPRNWREMSPSRRLMVWKFAAMKLNADGTGFPTLTEELLIDSYNMLALPGTYNYVPLPTDNLATKTRFHLYQQVRQLAESGAWEPNVLDLLEAAATKRDTAVDHLLRQISHIPLRLK